MKINFKALWIDNPDSDPNQIDQVQTQWRETKTEDLTKGDVFIKIQYSAINYKDALAVTGHGKILRKLPLIPGIDLSGYVVQSRSSQFKEGDPVLVNGSNLGEKYCGGFSEYARLPSQIVIPRPKSLNAREAAGIGTAGFTAALAIHQMEKNGLNPNQGEVLVTGSCGGVGSMALAFLNQLGYRTEAWTRRKKHESWIKNCGASKVNDIRKKNFQTRFLESTIWAGAIDNVGGEILSHILPRINLRGPVASIGLTKNHELKTSLFPFILRGVNLLGISSNNCPMELKKKLWEKIATTIKPENLDHIITEEISCNKLINTCHKIIKGEHLGRILVKF